MKIAPGHRRIAFRGQLRSAGACSKAAARLPWGTARVVAPSGQFTSAAPFGSLALIHPRPPSHDAPTGQTSGDGRDPLGAAIHEAPSGHRCSAAPNLIERAISSPPSGHLGRARSTCSGEATAPASTGHTTTASPDPLRPSVQPSSAFGPSLWRRAGAPKPTTTRR